MAKQNLSAAERKRRSDQARINFGLRPGAGVNIGQRESVLIGTGGRKYPIQVPPPGFGGTNRTSPPSGVPHATSDLGADRLVPRNRGPGMIPFMFNFGIAP